MHWKIVVASVLGLAGLAAILVGLVAGADPEGRGAPLMGHCFTGAAVALAAVLGVWMLP